METETKNTTKDLINRIQSMPAVFSRHVCITPPHFVLSMSLEEKEWLIKVLTKYSKLEKALKE